MGSRGVCHHAILTFVALITGRSNQRHQEMFSRRIDGCDGGKEARWIGHSHRKVLVAVYKRGNGGVVGLTSILAIIIPELTYFHGLLLPALARVDVRSDALTALARAVT